MAWRDLSTNTGTAPSHGSRHGARIRTTWHPADAASAAFARFLRQPGTNPAQQAIWRQSTPGRRGLPSADLEHGNEIEPTGVDEPGLPRAQKLRLAETRTVRGTPNCSEPKAVLAR